MHDFIQGSAQQPAVTGEGTLKGAAHLQGHEANNAFNAANIAMSAPAPIQIPLENISRGMMAQIRATGAEGSERGDN